jgi:hypothetical protein
MRKLMATDIFAFCRVVNAIGIKDEVKKIAMKANSVKDIADNQEELGFELLFTVFEKATQKKSENELFNFFAGIFEMPVEEVKELDPVDFIDKVLESAEIDKWKAFFSRVASLMRQK